MNSVRVRRRLARNFTLIALPALITALTLVIAFMGYVVYAITHPAPLPPEAVTPANYLLAFSEISWATRRGDEVSGWFIPGSRGAPVIIMCHGYRSNRAKVLDLAGVLHEGGYNLVVFNMRGHGQKRLSRTSLGLYERDDVRAAVDLALSRYQVDKKVGLWGASVGAYAVLCAAVDDQRIAAIVVDSAYPNLRSFIRVQAKNLLGFDSPVASKLAEWLFSLYFFVSPARLAEDVPLDRLKHVQMLFITGLNSPDLGTLTRRMYVEMSGSKDILQLVKSRDLSHDDFLSINEQKIYNDNVLGFFRRTLPVRGLGL